MPKYLEVNPVPTTLSKSGLLSALGMVTYSRPMLIVNPDQMGLAEGLAQSLFLNVVTDPDLAPGEWYIEHDGKRVGSNPRIYG